MSLMDVRSARAGRCAPSLAKGFLKFLREDRLKMNVKLELPTVQLVLLVIIQEQLEMNLELELPSVQLVLVTLHIRENDEHDRIIKGYCYLGITGGGEQSK